MRGRVLGWSLVLIAVTAVSGVSPGCGGGGDAAVPPGRLVLEPYELQGVEGRLLRLCGGAPRAVRLRYAGPKRSFEVALVVADQDGVEQRHSLGTMARIGDEAIDQVVHVAIEDLPRSTAAPERAGGDAGGPSLVVRCAGADGEGMSFERLLGDLIPPAVTGLLTQVPAAPVQVPDDSAVTLFTLSLTGGEGSAKLRVEISVA